jgi:hypothetical protein
MVVVKRRPGRDILEEWIDPVAGASQGEVGQERKAGLEREIASLALKA